jgi:hypothetical protein
MLTILEKSQNYNSQRRVVLVLGFPIGALEWLELFKRLFKSSSVHVPMI